MLLKCLHFKSNLQIQCNPYQNTNKIFTELGNHERPTIAKANLNKKNQAGGIIIPDFKAHYSSQCSAPQCHSHLLPPPPPLNRGWLCLTCMLILANVQGLQIWLKAWLEIKVREWIRIYKLRLSQPRPPKWQTVWKPSTDGLSMVWYLRRNGTPATHWVPRSPWKTNLHGDWSWTSSNSPNTGERKW